MKYLLLVLLLTGCVSDCRFKPTVYVEANQPKDIYEYVDGGMAAVQCKHDWMK